MIVTRFFCKTEMLRDFLCTLKAGIYSRRRTLLIQKKVGSALTETENWDLLVDCTSRDGRQMLDAGVHLSDKRTLLINEDAQTVSNTVQNILPNPLLL
jgi:hypothetical protein